MLANFLSKSKPINFITFLGFFFVLFLFVVYNTFLKIDFQIENLLKSSVILLFFLSIFFFYNFIISKNSLTFDNSYAFFLFLMFVCFLLPYLIDYKPLLLLILHLLFLRKVYSLKSIKEVLKKLFDAGFWLGVSFLFEPFFALFFILMYVGAFLHQKITIHTIFSPIIGFITPLIIYFTYCFWFDKTEEFLQLFYFQDSNTILIYTENNMVWFLGSLFLLTLTSLVVKSPKAFSINNSFKRNWTLLILNLVLTFLFFLIIPEKNGTEIVYLLFPASIIIANGLEVIKSKLIKNIVFVLILAGVIINQFLL